MENKDQPAFPHLTYNEHTGKPNGLCSGLTKREYFAAQALVGVGDRAIGEPAEETAKYCFRIADAMLDGSGMGNPIGWISVQDRLPDIDPETNCSKNVFVLIDNKVHVMSYCYINDSSIGGFVWCNCYGVIHGDGHFDDNYSPTHWQPLPEPPKPTEQ